MDFTLAKYVWGADYSHWQDNNSTPQQVNFAQAYAAGIRFGIFKSSQGVALDEDILYNWKTSKAANILRSAYHFLIWNIAPAKQAQYAWSLIEKDPPELPPVVDFEWWGTIPTKAYDLLWQYCQEMKRLSGRSPMIYSSAFFWQKYGTQAVSWKEFPLWMASYTTQEYMEKNIIDLTPWDTWTFWQFTDKGPGRKYGAESEQLDLNYFNGSYQDLLAFAGLQVTPEEPPVQPVSDKVYWELVDLRNSMQKNVEEIEYILTLAKPT